MLNNAWELFNGQKRFVCLRTQNKHKKFPSFCLSVSLVGPVRGRKKFRCLLCTKCSSAGIEIQSKILIPILILKKKFAERN